jgi:hypothetical protein
MSPRRKSINDLWDFSLLALMASGDTAVCFSR